jgi:SAM-dependent methyltransferase
MNKSGWLSYWVDPETWRFRGNFEEMYRDFDDPWECSKNVSMLRRDISLMILFRERRFNRILDIGCGLGAFTERIRVANGACQTILGLDISETAVEKARRQFPKCSFTVLDVSNQPLPGEGQSAWDLILVSELLWYVLPQLKSLLSRIHGALTPSGTLFIQQFYPADQRFGLEYLTSPGELYDRYLLPAGFRRETELLEVIEDGRVQLASLTKQRSEEEKRAGI